ncbi:MAG TPA: mannose-6-phosphate isomerase, class I [Pseudonocardiaceae bacterium]|jgi:mannose-6-phosphate isomerase|nr:mannose-6-phosphate isomerase, class I [Pseudonocardiaceae bacterium]
MELLQGAVRHYVWGSRTAIAELLGAPVPAPHPQAELWLGAHPADPSMLLGRDGARTSLLAALQQDPERELGAGCLRRWGHRLPFLLKVLAADESLSLQAHPSAQQAAEGFAREEALGIARGAPERNYPDPHHKPELVCALTEFHALAGFREVGRTVELLTALNVPQLAPYRELLAGQPDADGLRALFTTWITLPQPAIDALLPPLLDGCIGLLQAPGPFAPECRTVLQLAEVHPRDAGVLASALLNHIVLAPGEALYLPAGKLHAYLRGTAVEIMANSDNVLRGGLTPKHVDVPELLRVLDFAHGDLPVQRGRQGWPRETAYDAPAPEFALSRLDWPAGDLASVRLAGCGPQILLCTAGTADVRTDDGGVLPLARGTSVWLAAADRDVAVGPRAGPVQLFRASLGPRGDQPVGSLRPRRPASVTAVRGPTVR